MEPQSTDESEPPSRDQAGETKDKDKVSKKGASGGRKAQPAKRSSSETSRGSAAKKIKKEPAEEKLSREARPFAELSQEE